jgi:hypothetical protein
MLSWGEIDLTRKLIVLPASRVKNGQHLTSSFIDRSPCPSASFVRNSSRQDVACKAQQNIQTEISAKANIAGVASAPRAPSTHRHKASREFNASGVSFSLEQRKAAIPPTRIGPIVQDRHHRRRLRNLETARASQA